MITSESRETNENLVDEFWALVNDDPRGDLLVPGVGQQVEKEERINTFLNKAGKYMCSISAIIGIEIEVDSNGCGTLKGKLELCRDALKAFAQEVEIDSAYLDNVVCDVYSDSTKVFSMSVRVEGVRLVPYHNTYFDVRYCDLPPTPEAGRDDGANSR